LTRWPTIYPEDGGTCRDSAIGDLRCVERSWRARAGSHVTKVKSSHLPMISPPKAGEQTTETRLRAPAEPTVGCVRPRQPPATHDGLPPSHAPPYTMAGRPRGGDASKG
jgi:hypothetical protein